MKSKQVQDLVEAGRSNVFDAGTVTLKVGSQWFQMPVFTPQELQTLLLTSCEQEGHTWVTLHLNIEKLFNIAALCIYSSVIIYLVVSYIFLLPLGPVYNSVPCNSSTCFDRSGNVGLMLFCTLVSL